jgi:adenine phosphoribosyltransferase
MEQEKIYKKLIRDVADFPAKGIIFRDITPLLGNALAFTSAVDDMANEFIGKNIKFVAAVEARGFIFGSAIAERLKAGFIPIRKAGKLPYKTQSYSYSLEYGTDTLQIHQDCLTKGDNVLLVDDLLATGGTMNAAAKLVEQVGGTVVGISFLIELAFLKGRDKLNNYKISTQITY